jgi:uncharacterized membrane protein HdeD (DUF308 family)
MAGRYNLEPYFASIEDIRQNWKTFLTLGIFLVVIGVLAVGAASLTSLFTIVLVAATLIVAGITKLIYSFWARHWSGFFISMLGGLLYSVVGILFLAKPLPALAAATLIIGILFVVSGVFKILASLLYRFQQWGWVLLSGVLGLALGCMILADWPEASLWVIGLFVGIDLIFYGWTWILLALAAKQNSKVQ